MIKKFLLVFIFFVCFFVNAYASDEFVLSCTEDGEIDWLSWCENCGFFADFEIDEDGFITVASSVFNLSRFNCMGAIAWENTYFPESSATIGDIKLDGNGDVIATGTYATGKVDSDGNKIWDYLGYSGGFNAIAIDTSNNVYLAGMDLKLQALDSNGNELWFQQYWEEYIYNGNYRDILFDNEESLILTGYYNEDSDFRNSIVNKYDLQGNIQWSFEIDKHVLQKEAEAELNIEAKKLAITEQQEVIVAGDVEDGNDRELFALAIDFEGTLLWFATFPGVRFLSDMEVDHNNNVLLTGGQDLYYIAQSNFIVVKYDENGILQWQSSYIFDSFSSSEDIAVNSQNEIFVAGWMCLEDMYPLDPEECDIALLKIDEDGNEIFKKTIGQDGQDEYAYRVEFDDQGNAYVAGQAQYFEIDDDDNNDDSSPTDADDDDDDSGCGCGG